MGFVVVGGKTHSDGLAEKRERVGDRQTDRQTDRYTVTERHRDTETEREMFVCWLLNVPATCYTDRQTGRQTDSKTDRETDRQTVRQTGDRQTDR